MRFFDLRLNERQIDLVVGALAELPYKVAAPMIQEIGRQVNVIEPSNDVESEDEIQPEGRT